MTKLFPERFTDKQAEETAKLLLNLCQTSFIGSVGVLFIQDNSLFQKIFLISVGMILGASLYIISINLLKDIKHV